MQTLLSFLLIAVGAGQVVMMTAVIRLPVWLNWRAETAKLEPVTRQVFWIYAGYIFTTNLFIGFVTVGFPVELIAHTPLVTALTGFMFLYWAVRLVLQLFVIDKAAAPKGLMFKVGDWVLTLLFTFFTAVYGWAFGLNLQEAI
ncbi:hypothetical protein [Rubellicoccus peritrichatus]|uniref:Uncharacterized protein n=1 Tax=Rubellicoccus peritrichatus TaxID=3080537 RepID=A0AAQ3L6Q8_9BACT|nr:hypothetical protein [Puniceicoccus sp. CR14]WOO40026.1 hypothetical protein RZN69_15490 [Puniceicoccus sp. CR14]